jgi:hypothetical protein
MVQPAGSVAKAIIERKSRPRKHLAEPKQASANAFAVTSRSENKQDLS